METMRPSGPVKLESIESGIYKEVGIYAWDDLITWWNSSMRGEFGVGIPVKLKKNVYLGWKVGFLTFLLETKMILTGSSTEEWIKGFCFVFLLLPLPIVVKKQKKNW